MLQLHLKAIAIIHQSGTLQRLAINQMQSIKLNNKDQTSKTLPKLLRDKREL